MQDAAFQAHDQILCNNTLNSTQKKHQNPLYSVSERPQTFTKALIYNESKKREKTSKQMNKPSKVTANVDENVFGISVKTKEINAFFVGSGFKMVVSF